MAVCVSLVAVSGKQGMNSVTITPNQLLAPSSESIDTCSMILLDHVEYLEFKDSYKNFAFDPDVFDQAVGAALMMFVIGLGVGLIISTIRKAQRI